jgi:hypothetical protein
LICGGKKMARTTTNTMSDTRSDESMLFISLSQ